MRNPSSNGQVFLHGHDKEGKLRPLPLDGQTALSELEEPYACNKLQIELQEALPVLTSKADKDRYQFLTEYNPLISPLQHHLSSY